MGRKPSSLDAYRAKRDPERTSEPFGTMRPGRGSLFVVQKHRARRLHYDLRLEIDGVLKSWAVPKGPSVKPEEKRLAVHVEDHPVEYADFEGTIAEGNYGAGAVIVWDRGWYRLLKDEDPMQQLGSGKLEFELFGFKLRGRWTLVRMGGKHKEWLLLKKADPWAGGDEPVEHSPESVLSGISVEGVGEAPERLASIRGRLKSLKAPRRDVSARAQPLMLASIAEHPFSGKDWLFEIKFDGVRALASRNGKNTELYGRNRQIITGRYPEIERALRTLGVPHFLLDGEIVAFDEDRRPSFQRLQERMHLSNPLDVEAAARTVPVTAIFFDCLALEGHDLRQVPLVERKDLLRLVVPARGVIQYGDAIREHGQAFFEAASEQRLEGIIAKRAVSTYVAGRSRDWLKIKCQLRQEFVIGGYTDPQGSRGYFGALHLGRYEGGRLVYVSKVGTGFDERSLKRLWEKLQPIVRSSSPFAVGGPTGRGHHWVDPKLVCEVRFTEWTRDGGIRHPSFLGLREDKRPEECRREEPVVRNASPPPAVTLADPPHVKITNPGKLFWPEQGYTKKDLVDYYAEVAPFLLPYLKDRPLVLTRYPDGIHGKSFFQKDAPDFVPPWVRTERIDSKDTEREIDYFIVDDLETLRYVVNLGTIPLHLWASRLSSLDRPDWLVLDLDPKGAPFTDVVKVARSLYRILAELELESYPKTSGATGIHILLPLGTKYSYEETRGFARLLALLAVEAEAEIATIARPIRSRQGKVYVDFGQNGHGQTIVAPFSVRPLAGAPVSCPLRWSEVNARLDPGRFTIKNAPKRFAALGDPLAPVLARSIDMAKTLVAIERRLKRSETRPPPR